MSEHDSNHDHADSGIQAVGQRIKDLTAQIDALTRVRQRRQRLAAALGVILAVTVSFSLMGVTNLGRQLDADAVAEISRGELERRLPSARMDTQVYLEREAPRLVGRSLEAMLDLMPRLRGLLLRGVLEKMDTLNGNFERGTLALMTAAIQDTKADLDRTQPHLGDREKLEALVDAVAKRFETNVAAATRGLYPAYRTEMDQIGAKLDRLLQADFAALSEEERVHKGIIETLMQLIAASKQKQKQQQR